mmetsp:Transcript_15352/g.39063  ORF Transcript_15352/g.39063 Transcript_15352/m.39063 type:complete len:218 (+) Transcript_15352:239-892(+)
MCRNIITELSKRAVGLARSCPAMSGAVPCTASAKAIPLSPMLMLGVSPSPPTSPAHRSLTMSPYRLGMTNTSNCEGSLTSCMQQLSMIFSSYVMSGYSSAIFLQHARKRPSAFFMMFALWTDVTFLRLFFVAYSNAYSATLVLAFSVMTLRLSTTPGTTSCSRPLYSPSVFSLTITMSTSSCLVLRPGIEKAWTRLAYRSSSFLSITFRLCVFVFSL